MKWSALEPIYKRIWLLNKMDLSLIGFGIICNISKENDIAVIFEVVRNYETIKTLSVQKYP